MPPQLLKLLYRESRHLVNTTLFSELKQIQNEKRRLLVETETDKLKSLDESFKRKFDHWRDKLEPRKQVGLFLFIHFTLTFSKTGARRAILETNARVGAILQSTGSAPSTLAGLKAIVDILSHLLSAVNNVNQTTITTGVCLFFLSNKKQSLNAKNSNE